VLTLDRGGSRRWIGGGGGPVVLAYGGGSVWLCSEAMEGCGGLVVRRGDGAALLYAA
jgi:hypothetical protein